MGMKTIHIPLAVLRSKALTPATKLLWITIFMDSKQKLKRSHAPTHLARRTGLARSTVYEALNRASRLGWLTSYRDRSSRKKRWRAVLPVRHSGAKVAIPVDLIEVRDTVRPQALLCFGLLQITAGFKRWTGTFKWAEFSRLTGLHLRTVKRAVRALVQAGWVRIAQKNRLAPMFFRLQHADEARRQEVERRLERSEYKGEALMREALSLIVDTQVSVDHARPEFLINPTTGERLEFDRYYPLDRVAFEFNGPQHYRATGRFTKEEVAAQRRRDAIKHRICKEEGITLVVVHAEDLSIETMISKVRGLLPLRNLRGYERTLNYIEAVCKRHRRRACSA